VRQRRFRYPGRKPLDDRQVLQGILFVLHTGIGWEHLPQELGATSVADLRNAGRLELRTNSRASALDVEAGVLIVAHQSARGCDRLWLS
jgi:transposase